MRDKTEEASAMNFAASKANSNAIRTHALSLLFEGYKKRLPGLAARGLHEELKEHSQMR